ncbi:MAG: HEAT repeat domain-containing protein, partial [candidate division Zixibacteria bacterium]|nr:HEAT repeat domain-containing protein [candidate division Zixibacteria bacterium]
SCSADQTPDTTLIFNKEFELSQEKETIINQLSANDASFDPYESTLELLKEMLHQETEATAFNETVTICEKIMNDFIIEGKLLEASLLLQYMKKFGSKIAHKKPMWSERIKETMTIFGSREKLRILSQSLNNHPEIGAGFLKQYLVNFGWEALIGLTELIPKLKNQSQKDALCDYLAVTGQKNLNIISRGVDDKNPEIVKNCVIVLSRIDSNQALKYLLKVVKHNNRNVRLTLAESLKESELKDAIEILKNLAVDKDPEIRKVAVSSLSSKHGPKAFDAIAEIINDDNFEEIDRNDQQLMFNAFSILGGDIAVTYLLKLILRYNLIGSSALKFYRSAAFEALSLNKSEKADQVLVKLSNSWRPSIKQFAQKTLNIRRTVMYGGEDE